MSKILRIVLIILLAVSAVLGILFYAGGEDVSGQPVYTNTFIGWAFILAGIAVAFAVIFPIFQMFKNPKAAVKGLLGLLVVAVVVFIAYAVSSGEELGITNPELMQYDVPGTLKYAGTLLNSAYLLAGLAILSMIYSEVSKMFK
ncbi:MAG: ABC-2 transporter permease [Bacteroidales bacterium]